MKLEELYSKDISRAVNPAVSATKLDPETCEVEIREYVFTDEIMNGLYRILNAIRNNKNFDHVGIWIDGYYGSGKSHFLKYLDYCISPETQEAALNRFIESVEDIDPLDDKHDLEFTKEDLSAIASWLKKATIDTCIFNLETSYDQSTDKKDAFLQVFWSEFNKLRGFNEFNITLAQSLEKPLADKGLFDKFKERIAEAGGDWETDAADIVDNELQWVLDLAAELAPTLDTESIRQRILNRDTNMSIKNFARELNSYLESRGDNYRLIMLVDEVSQFINANRDRYLNLQELITHLSEACGNRVWIACTAQQDLSEVVNACNVSQGIEDMGKILGRFEVKVSLKGTQAEVITQKRILDKKEVAKKPLLSLYKEQKDGFTQRFALPSSFKGYSTPEDFIDYYPFVPYQFQLIMKVFDHFLKLGYVAKEVKGNERSIIKVVHSTAKNNREKELGTLISFDQLYDNMFETGLQARGQKAIENAKKMAEEYGEKPEDIKLAKRVVNVLFMVCNISDTDKLIFPATLQNVTTLLLNDFITPFLTLKENVRKVIEFLCEKNVIREEKAQKGIDPFYSFYSEEEMKVAELIKSQVVDTTYQASQLQEVIQKYFTSMRPKEQYKTRSFSVGGSVMQKTFLNASNPDVTVEFNMDATTDVSQMILRNVGKNLVFLCGTAFHADRRLVNDFAWYCKVQKYSETPAPNKENEDVRTEFKKRAFDTLTSQIIPKLRNVLDTAPVLSGNSEIDELILAGKKGADRYTAAMTHHLGMIYPQAGLIDNSKTPRDTSALRAAILRPVQSGEYDGMGASLTSPEQEVERYLLKQGGLDVTLTQITAKFALPPYGWLEICTMYVVNELVRRHRRDFSYTNNRNVDPQTVASKIVTETAKFAVREGEAIPQDLINKFIDAWKHIFGQHMTFASTDSTQIYRNAQDTLDKLGENHDAIITMYSRYGFISPNKQLKEYIRKWLPIRDVSKFFKTIIDDSEAMAKIVDACKEVSEFTTDQMDRFKDVVRFADENRDNFSFLSPELQSLAEDLKNLKDAPWPIKMREYLKKKKEVETALNEVRNEIRERIKEEYTKTYELLCESAKKEGVNLAMVAEPSAIYASKCMSGNIFLLRNNVDTDDYFTREAEKIQREKIKKTQPTPPTPPSGSGTGSGSQLTPKTYPVTCTITLDTRAVGLADETAVDAYLAKLKAKIMEKIKDNKIVTIK